MKKIDDFDKDILSAYEQGELISTKRPKKKEKNLRQLRKPPS